MRLVATLVLLSAGCSLTPLDQHGSGSTSASDAATSGTGAGGGTGASSTASTSGSGAAPVGEYAREVLADAPLAYWRLGERRGSTAMDAIGALDGTYVGPVLLGGTGAIIDDPAPTFDGGTTYVTMGPADPLAFLGTAAFTLEAWIKPTAAPDGTETICGRWTTGADSRGYLFYITMGGLFFERWTGGSPTSVSTETLPELDVFSHVVATYDGAATRLYVNGTPVGIEPAPDSMPAHTALFVIAATVSGQVEDDFFPGTIDEVAVYDHALVQSRIAAHYTAATSMQP